MISSHFYVNPLQLSRLIGDCLFVVKFLERAEHSGRGLPVLIGQVEEVDDLANGGVFNDYHMLGEHFQQSD